MGSPTKLNQPTYRRAKTRIPFLASNRLNHTQAFNFCQAVQENIFEKYFPADFSRQGLIYPISTQTVKGIAFAIHKKTARTCLRAGRSRTGDLLVPNQARYHLRYCPETTRGLNEQQIVALPKMPWALLGTGATGLEPAISGLTGQRDKPTSLRPQRFLQHSLFTKLCQYATPIFFWDSPTKSTQRRHQAWLSCWDAAGVSGPFPRFGGYVPW